MATVEGPTYDSSPLLPLVEWEDQYKDRLNYLEYTSPVFASSPIWAELIKAYGSQDTELAYKPAIAASRMKDPYVGGNDAQLSSWGLSSDGFNPDNLLGFKEFFPTLQTYWSQYVKDRGTSISFIGFIEWAFNVDISYIPLSIAKTGSTTSTDETYFLANTALSGATEITVTPFISDTSARYYVNTPSGDSISSTVLMQTNSGTVLTLSSPLTSILLANRSLVITKVTLNADAKLDINTLQPESTAPSSPNGPNYPSPYFDIYFRPRLNGQPTLNYDQLIEILTFIKPIYLVQREVAERYQSIDTITIGAALAFYTREQEVLCTTTKTSGTSILSAGAFKFWANASAEI